MANHQNTLEEMEASFASFKMDDEEGGISYENNTEDLSEIDVRWCLIGKPYSAWMKAEPRRRSHTMGAKWLRQGGRNPVAFPADRDVEEGGKEIATKTAGDKQNPVIVANKLDMVLDAKQKELGENQGITTCRGENISQFLTQAKIAGENIGLNEEVGLQVLDPKRRRIDEPTGAGLSISNVEDETDFDMTDEGNITVIGSKNGNLAGSALQTRLSS
ncbi:hypothetical protein POM88_036835 [Heracleum sosnowskyi]|uniref:Uncharacterized protein n=1 Tax=Heracleum sosnowskyi TaxID=360622 RepID=A0AAD8MG33_9APIA|nr:hypothetical protein POM88_036835 [Heracleum sosnowskyi]